ncbi:helix-turn-helix domain-containing protein [Paraburkholderia sp. SIMBA_054]|uniref:helix-turn-helix domain-containing protein n=1 Tax=Paraburkholderia sp. SIMBA_054 TaxID=3085795 RepID=UPI00397D966C
MSTTQTIIKPKVRAESQYVTMTSPVVPAYALVLLETKPEPTPHRNTPKQALQERPEWTDREFREAYADASIEEGLAWQIRANREGRHMTQKELGEAIGTTQTGIHRFEDPEYGKHSLDTLVKLAHAFDCALSVRFVPYSQLAIESEDLSPEALYATPYEVEAELFGISQYAVGE